MEIKFKKYLDLINRLDKRFLEAGEEKTLKWLQKLILKHYLEENRRVVFENRVGERAVFWLKGSHQEESLQERDFCRFMSKRKNKSIY
jgi:hypothetical protein